MELQRKEILELKQKQIFEKQTGLYKERAEKNTFDSKYRRKLLQSAKGKVLEVAVGAGVNFQFYTKDVEVTAVEFIPALSAIAEQMAQKHKIRAEFINQNVETLEFEDNSFDTVISTWSLCAYKEPLDVLNKFNRWCKPDGQILLFEHGLNGNRFLDWPLKRINNWHWTKRGCHASTDIHKLIKDSYIVPEKIEKALFFYYLIWARPNKNL